MATNILPAADTQTDRKSIQFNSNQIQSNRFESIKNKSQTDSVAKGLSFVFNQVTGFKSPADTKTS